MVQYNNDFFLKKGESMKKVQVKLSRANRVLAATIGSGKISNGVELAINNCRHENNIDHDYKKVIASNDKKQCCLYISEDCRLKALGIGINLLATGYGAVSAGIEYALHQYSERVNSTNKHARTEHTQEEYAQEEYAQEEYTVEELLEERLKKNGFTLIADGIDLESGERFKAYHRHERNNLCIRYIVSGKIEQIDAICELEESKEMLLSHEKFGDKSRFVYTFKEQNFTNK